MAPSQGPDVTHSSSIEQNESNNDENGQMNTNNSPSQKVTWKRFLGVRKRSPYDSAEDGYGNREKRTLGILSDKHTDEVPGKAKPNNSTTTFLFYVVLVANHLFPRNHSPACL